jgi:hypothetical protein
MPHSRGGHDECVSMPEIEITPQMLQTVILNLDKFRENVTLLPFVCQVAADGLYGDEEIDQNDRAGKKK